MTSIVVLTYNQLEDCTKSCIESIYKYTDIKDFELIVVDNDSQDGTPEYLKSIEPNYSNISIILNDTNKGYSAGNNDGIKVSKGEYVILLNNDTLVSEDWLEQILKPFKKDKSIGMVGPISNSVGNEQRVNIDGLNDKNYNEKIAKYIDDNKDIVTYTQRLGFFCVAIKKELIDKIGLLDEKFGIGMFEDDDYCMRTTKANYKLVVTDGCFIYHKGSVSFKKLTTDAYHEIFTKNKKYFLEKHGVEWSLSDISFAYWDKFNDDLKEYEKNSNASAINRISVRFDNFKHLLFQVREVELKKSNIVNSVATNSISKTKWQIRIKNLKDELIFSSLSDKKRYIKFGLYNFMSSNLVVFHDLYIDNLVILKYVSVEKVGIYGLAGTIVGLSLMFDPGRILKNVYNTILVSKYSEKQNLDVLFKGYHFLNKISLFLFIPAMVGVFLICDKIIIFIFNPEYIESASILVILIPFFIFRTLMGPISQVIGILEKNHIFLFCGFSSLYNLIMDLVLVQYFLHFS